MKPVFFFVNYVVKDQAIFLHKFVLVRNRKKSALGVSLIIQFVISWLLHTRLHCTVVETVKMALCIGDEVWQKISCFDGNKNHVKLFKKCPDTLLLLHQLEGR